MTLPLILACLAGYLLLTFVVCVVVGRTIRFGTTDEEKASELWDLSEISWDFPERRIDG